MKITVIICLFLFFLMQGITVFAQDEYHEMYRPQIHFSPREKWMNDPNGMVYFKGEYHLFFQYFPDSTVWGPMHWGHAVSKDLVRWKQLPIALYPDSLGYIFSGSAVADINNTSGFGKNGKVPLVAIFTHHDPIAEKAGRSDFQNQSIAYSLDQGRTWTKYTANPVVKNPGIRDFRDPKVIWFEAGKKWIMTLAAGDRIMFYSSMDLKNWTKESETGKGIGAHGGVWECPDLVPFKKEGKDIWVLIVNINPGGMQGGSGTQYFTGDFDGHEFHMTDTLTRWADFGADNYAGVTWSNTDTRKIFMGWMSNWEYAGLVPTMKWRSAMTIPRDLDLQLVDGKYLLTMQPATELDRLSAGSNLIGRVNSSTFPVARKTASPSGNFRLDITADSISSFSVNFSNSKSDKLVAGYDMATNTFYIDRSKAGRSDFFRPFATKHSAPRFSKDHSLKLTIVMDNASIEMFADNGLTCMTDIFFPSEPLTDIRIQSSTGFIASNIKLTELKSIWR